MLLATLAYAWWAVLLSLITGVLFFFGASYLFKKTTVEKSTDRYSSDLEVWRFNYGAGIISGVLSAALLLLIIGGLNSMTTVGYDETCAVTRIGALTGKILDPGLNFLSPFIEKKLCFPTVQRSYEVSENPDTSKANFTDYVVTAQTSDGQQITVNYTVLFRVNKESVLSVAQNIGTINNIVENVVKAHSRNLTRVLAQNYTAEALYKGTGIQEYQAEVKTVLNNKMVEVGHGVVLDDFLVRKIGFDPDYVQAIEDKQIEREKIQTAEYQAQQAQYEGEKQVTLSKAQAQQKVIQADADAQVTKINADAQAYSIEQQGKMLNRYPEMIQYQFVTKMSSSVNWGIMPDTILPFLNVTK